MKKLKQFINSILRLAIGSNRKISLRELMAYIRYHGFYNVFLFFLHKKNILTSKQNPYHLWLINKHSPNLLELEQQRTHKFPYEPLISIIVPTYNTPKQFLIEMLNSVLAQTYSNWELCIADGASNNDETLDVLRDYAKKDSRIKVIFLAINYHISGNTNEALMIAGGDYIGFFDHDDILAPNCVFEYVSAINQNNKPALLYCDEDKLSADSKVFFNPTFKPDFALDTLRTKNYICHWLVIRKDILDMVGEFDSKCDGAQDYDMVLRVVDITRDIIHIPKFLYHWRVHPKSTASGFSSAKPYTHDAGMLALNKHLKRNKLVGKISEGVGVNIYKIDYELSDSPLISIIVAIEDVTRNIYKCIESIYKNTIYSNYEIVLIKQNNMNIDINNLQSKYPGLKISLHISGIPGRAAMYNLGVARAKGEYLMFINSKVEEVISPRWLEEMLVFARRKDIGAVGSKICYPNNKLYNCGLIVGVGSLGIASYAYHNAPKSYGGYRDLLSTVHNLSAISLNGMMIEKSKLCEVSGFDESYKVALFDIDLSLRLRWAGYSLVWTPYARLLYNQKKHLNYCDEHAHKVDFQFDVSTFKAKYGYLNDPYYNINFSKLNELYSLDIPLYNKLYRP